MKKLKSIFRLGLLNVLLPVVVSYFVLLSLNSKTGILDVTKSSTEIAKAGLEFAKDLQALALAAMGALGAFLFKINEQRRLASAGHQLATLALGFLCAAVYLGYESQVAALRLWGDTGAIKLDEGPYHYAISMQVIALALGAACYGLLVLFLIQHPRDHE